MLLVVSASASAAELPPPAGTTSGTPAQPLGAFVASDADWTALGGLGFAAFPRTWAVAIGADGDVYVAGEFTQSPDGSANRVAKRDGSTWADLGEGFVAVWDGSEWNAPGGGFE